MATARIYYIDTFNFADATAVYTDAALTTFAADGFYQMGGLTARQQVSGILKAAESCPSCSKPSPDPIPSATNAFKITDIITGTQDHVILNNNFAVGQEVTTSINSNCWLIDAFAVNPSSNTISGVCVPDPGTPALYYLLNLCPVSAGTGAVSAIFTSIPPTSTKFIYLNTNSNAYYSYSNAAPINTPSPNIPLVETGISLTSNSSCPAVPPAYTYWNAQECNDPNITVIIRAPEATSFIVGTSVKISSTCYEIISQRIGSAVTYDKQYLSGETVYTACTTGANPCIPAVVATPSFNVVETTSAATNLVTKRNGFSQNDNIVITGLAGCWKLVSPSTVATSNTIQDFCPTVTACAEYEVGGTYSYVECYSGITQSGSIGGDSFPACARLDSATSDAAGLPEFISVCFDDIAPPNPFNYYTAVACLYPNSTPIIARNNGSVIQTGRSIKVSGSSTCYLITGLSNNQSNYSDIVNEYQDCAECNPPAACFEFSVDSNTSNTKCPENNPTTVYGNTADFTTASKLYINQLACQNGQAATVGTYAQAVNNNQRVSRYWDGNNLFSPLTCDPVDVFVTATINNIQNDIKGSDVNVGYTITGSGIGSQTTGVSPLLIPSGGSAPFNTGVSVNSGYNITTPIVVSYDTASITQDSNVGVTLTGEINLIPTVNYSVRTCGTQVIYSVDKGSTQAVNFDIIFFITDSGQQLCGEVTSTTSTPSSARALYIITQDGCDNSFCTGSTGGKPAF